MLAQIVTPQIVTPMFINNAGPWGLLLIAVVVLVLFGRGKIAGLMGEIGKGITAFKKGVKDGSDEIEDRRETDVPPPVARDVTPPRDRDNA
jgi:sec-independent protein translocase protein TatA